MPNDPLFRVHKLNPAGMEKARYMADDFSRLLECLRITLGDKESREFSICKTKLEEACFFAKKALASQPENQQKD